MRTQLTHTFEDIVSIENLLEAWQEFIKGKRNKQDVQEFGLHLIDHVWALHDELTNKTYRHGSYMPFNISDPKPRNIHKALVRDRLLHHAIHRKVYPLFDRTFITDSYSCRINKGTHKALDQFANFGRIMSQNGTKTCWVLKCDIRKFFASVDHDTLIRILHSYIPDHRILWLLDNVISSFETKKGLGLPLGNLTSQLLVNVYMNEFDQYVKHRLKARHYLRYADDFVVLSKDKQWLVYILQQIDSFLDTRLKLQLHEEKVCIKTFASGVDFLGWVHFPTHRILRTTTRQRMMKKILNNPSDETMSSYLGLLQHGDTYRLKQVIQNSTARSRNRGHNIYYPLIF